MRKTSASATNPPQSSASPPSGGKQSSPLTMGGLLSGFNRYTLGSPNSFMPKWMTGALPRAVLASGIGALAGRYLGPTAFRFLTPNLPHDHPVFQGKVKNLGTLGGGLLGLLATTPDLYTSFQAGRGTTDTGEFGPWTGGFKGLFGGSSYIPNQRVKQRVKTSSFWEAPIVDVEPMTEATRQAIYEGKTDPVGALQASLAFSKADRNNNGITTPGSIAGSITDSIIRAGTGAAMGYAVGRVGGALAGSLGLMSDSTKDKTGPATAVAGAISNMMLGSSLFK